MNEAKFPNYLLEVRDIVDGAMTRFFDGKLAAARRAGGSVEGVVEATRDLALRGGKRFRAALLAASYEACGGTGGLPAVVMAGVALELLQTYLLIHDDWMDNDDTRRGGPSVHAMLRGRLGDRALADACAILAGDHASAMAQEALLSVDVSADRLRDACREFARIQEDVVFGQLLDMHAGAQDASAVEKVHELKTGSYTVRGPLALGAVLAGASEAQRACLEAFARPLGIAFQLRDDVLGTFGDPSATGKPAGNDLRQGKRTALITELEGVGMAPSTKELFGRAFGAAQASDADVAGLMEVIVASGARARVEARLADLLGQAHRALEAGQQMHLFSSNGVALLAGAVDALGLRER
jgi:geranylgeranyl diphosphate synthase type I